MSQAASIVALERANAIHSVSVGDWLVLELSGAPHDIDAVVRGQSAGLVVRPAPPGSPHACVRLERCEPREPRWPDRPLTHSIVEWDTPSQGRAQMQSADARIEWNGTADDVLQADLRLDPDDAKAFETSLKLLTVLLGVVVRQRVLVHASAVLLDGEAVLFLGESEAGKSTTADRLENEGLTRIADDAVFVELGSDLRVYPYFGDRACRQASDDGWPLARAFRLEKGAERSHVKAAVSRALQLWLASLMVPPGPGSYAIRLVGIASTLASARVDTFAAAPGGVLLPALAGAMG